MGILSRKVCGSSIFSKLLPSIFLSSIWLEMRHINSISLILGINGVSYFPKLIKVWTVSLVALIILHIYIVTQLSLSIHVLFSIKINLFEVFVDLRLASAVGVRESVECVGGTHFVFICNLAVYNFINRWLVLVSLHHYFLLNLCVLQLLFIVLVFQCVCVLRRQHTLRLGLSLSTSLIPVDGVHRASAHLVGVSVRSHLV